MYTSMEKVACALQVKSKETFYNRVLRVKKTQGCNINKVEQAIAKVHYLHRYHHYHHQSLSRHVTHKVPAC